MSWAIWVTGLPGSGKSAVSRAVAERLRAAGEPAAVLELDVLRKILTPAPTYTDAEREVVYRALVYLARLLTAHGVPVVIDATAHRRQWRDLARATIANFAEIQLVCPLDLCRERERARTATHAPRGIYDAASRPGARVPGVNVPYEPALAPEVTVDTSVEDAESAAERITAVALDLARVAPARRRDAGPAPWALWITGLPGSGKTTLASATAEGLAERGVDVALLAVADVRQFLRPAVGGPQHEAIIHRTLVTGAKLLTDAGIPVIVDATAPRREWRELARDLIPHFAEVQLVCPPEICRARERATRWTPSVCATGSSPKIPADEAADLVLDYEAAVDPELILHTHVRDLWSASQEILRLAQRLHRTALRCFDHASMGDPNVRP